MADILPYCNVEGCNSKAPNSILDDNHEILYITYLCAKHYSEYSNKPMTDVPLKKEILKSRK